MHSAKKIKKKIKNTLSECNGHCTRQRKLKIKNKKHPLPSAGAVALGKEVKKNRFLCRVPELWHSAKSFFKKKIRRCRPSADGVKSLPSARTAFGKVFAECPKFGTRQSSLYRKGIRRRLFAECCTRQRLCRVQSCLCRVQ